MIGDGKNVDKNERVPNCFRLSKTKPSERNKLDKDTNHCIGIRLASLYYASTVFF